MAKFRPNLKPSPIVTKLFLVVVNFLFLIMGIAIVAVGIYFCTKANLIKLPEIFNRLEALRSVKFILMACGFFIVLVALCGFLGAFKENRFFIILYILLCSVILIGNLASVIMAFVYGKQVKSYIHDVIKYRMDRFYGGNETTEQGSDAFTKGIDEIQKMVECCGWRGADHPRPFNSTEWYKRQKSGNLHPDSCCPEKMRGKDACVKARDVPAARKAGNIYSEDCPDKLMAINNRFGRIAMGSVLGAILLQILCIVCSVVMASYLGSNDG